MKCEYVILEDTLKFTFIPYAVFTRDTCVTHLPQINVSRVNTALVSQHFIQQLT